MEHFKFLSDVYKLSNKCLLCVDMFVDWWCSEQID